MSGAFPEDTSALDAWASAHVEGWRGPVAVKKFPTGQSNPTYQIDSASGRYVLRRKPPGKLLKSAHLIEREFRVLKALERVDYPAPRPLAFCEDESVIGTTFYLMTFVDGRVLWNPALPELEREERGPIYAAMNDGLARLHSIDVAAAGLSDYGKPGSYFARQYQRWTDQYRASETARIEDMERLIAWLAENAPPDDGRVALVHGDWRIDNMIFDCERRRACSRCSTGNCRRSATRSPISPTSACNGGCRPANIADWAESTGPQTASRPKPNMSPPIASAWGLRAFRTGPSSSPSASSAASPSTRASISARWTATPRTRSLPGKWASSCLWWRISPGRESKPPLRRRLSGFRQM